MRRNWWKLLLVAVCILVVVEAALFVAVLVTARQMDAPQAADTMIVLGAGINMDGTPRTTLKNRLDRAAELYAQGLAPTIITTGAQGDDEPMPEAYAMRDYLVAQGVPEDAVYCEPASYNTKQNLANAKAIMDENGLSTAIVVTSDYHLWRSLHLAEDLGITATGAGAPNTTNTFSALQNCVRETLSWIKYFVTR